MTDLYLLLPVASLIFLRQRTRRWQRERFWPEVALCTGWCIFALYAGRDLFASCTYFIVARHVGFTLARRPEHGWLWAGPLMLSLLVFDPFQFGGGWLATIAAAALALPWARKRWTDTSPNGHPELSRQLDK